jgi:hypothetical protein
VIGRLSETIRKGNLLLVFTKHGGELIGMSNFTPIFDKSGWLGMARTDPDWRGMGVAQFMQRCTAKYTKKSGIRALRFFVLSTNIASLRAARKGGFKEVAHATHVTCDLKKSKLVEFSKEFQQEPVELNEVRRSVYLSKMNGFIRYGYSFVVGNHSNLQYIQRKKELFGFKKSAFILTKPEEDYGEFSILTGGIKQSLLKIIEISRKMKDTGHFRG